MSNKLYEEEDIRRIANSIRANAPRWVGQRTFLLDEMPSGIDDVYMEGYENGYNDITQHPNTSDDVDMEVSETSVTVTVSSGYYADEVKKILSEDTGALDPIIDKAYDEGLEAGYQQGYEDGKNAGGGGGKTITKWLLIDRPDLTSMTTSGFQISFTSNGVLYDAMTKSTRMGQSYINYKQGSSTTQVYNSATTALGGWVNSAYKSIDVHEADETAITWLLANGTLLSIGDE